MTDAERDPEVGGASSGVPGPGGWRQQAQRRRPAPRRRWLLLAAVAAAVALAGAAWVSVRWLTAEDEVSQALPQMTYRLGEDRAAAPGGEASHAIPYVTYRLGEGRAVAPEGLFVDVSVSEFQSCGVRADGRLVCWGEDVQFQRGMPDGRFVRMVGTGYYGEWCALGTDGKVACWGNWYEPLPPSSVPEGLRFSDASLGWGYGCGIELDGKTVCWDTASLERVEPAALLSKAWANNRRTHPGGLPLPDAGLTRLARGTAACAIDADGGLRGHCGHEPLSNHRGHEHDTFVEPPSGQFTAVALSVGHGCGLRVGGTLACWGYPYGTETTW